MNGDRLPLQHGYPVRLVVPGWYGVASVKWLTSIELVAQPFGGYFQADRYWYQLSDTREPVTLQRVRALITDPANGEELSGEATIRGVAWSGAAPISRVEVMINQGPWQPAHLIGESRRHCWQWWELPTRLGPPGQVAIRARATDEAGHTQPDTAEWNRDGYGNNAVQEVLATVG
jgi:DMSO/TMAO reductase YedYZ molybdopterin-dependent catalytic subunit